MKTFNPEEIRERLWRGYRNWEEYGDGDIADITGPWTKYLISFPKEEVLSFLKMVLHYYDERSPRWVATGWHPFVEKLIELIKCS